MAKKTMNHSSASINNSALFETAYTCKKVLSRRELDLLLSLCDEMKKSPSNDTAKKLTIETVALKECAYCLDDIAASLRVDDTDIDTTRSMIKAVTPKDTLDSIIWRATSIYISKQLCAFNSLVKSDKELSLTQCMARAFKDTPIEKPMRNVINRYTLYRGQDNVVLCPKEDDAIRNAPFTHFITHGCFIRQEGDKDILPVRGHAYEVPTKTKTDAFGVSTQKAVVSYRWDIKGAHVIKYWKWDDPKGDFSKDSLVSDLMLLGASEKDAQAAWDSVFGAEGKRSTGMKVRKGIDDEVSAALQAALLDW